MVCQFDEQGSPFGRAPSFHLLLAEEAMLLGAKIVVILFEGSKSSTAVVLGTTAALLITEMLAGVRREEACNVEYQSLRDTTSG